MARVRKDSQLQIRLTAQQKRRIEEQARRSGKTVSALALERLLGTEGRQFQTLIAELADATGERERLALAHLHDHLEELPGQDFASALPRPEVDLSDRQANILAAMVEYAARRKGVAPPEWTADIPPLDRPVFGSGLRSLREYLLVRSPVEFRRRNLFVDASVGARV